MKLSDLIGLLRAGASLNLPTAVSTATAGEAIQKGDLVVQAGDGLAYWALDPTAPGATTRPLSLDADAASGALTAPINPFSSAAPAGQQGMAQLTNGNLVVATASNAAPNAGAVVFSILTFQGVPISGPTKSVLPAESSRGATCQVGVVALSGGGFAMMSSGYFDAYPTVAVYDNSGALVSGPTALETTGAHTYAMQIKALTNGGFVAAYYTTNTFQVKLAYFNAAGAQQGSTITVATLQGAPSTNFPNAEMLRVVVVNNGNVAVVYQNCLTNTQTFSMRLAVYSGTGSVVSADANSPVVPGGYNGTAIASTSVVAATDGGFFIAASYQAATPAIAVAKYGAGGAQIGSVVLIYNTGTFVPTVRLTAIPGGGVFWGASTAISDTTGLNLWGVLDASLAVVVAARLVNMNGSTSSGSAYIALVPLNNGDVVYFGDYAASSLYAVRFGLTLGVWGQRDNGTPVAVGSAYTATTFGGTSSRGGTPHAVFSDALSAVANSFAIFPYNVTLSAPVLLTFNAFVQKRRFIGVATDNIAQGSAGPVGILGAWGTRLSMAKPYASDFSTASPPGQKSSLVGTMAVLKGIQP